MTGYSASPVFSARVFAGSCRSDCLSDSAILRWVAKVWASPSFMWLVPLGVSAVKTGATTRGSLKTQAFAFVAWAAQAWHKKCRSKIYSLQMRCSTPENFVHVLSEAQESSSCHQKAVHHRTAPTGMLKAKDASDTCRTAMGMRRCLTHKSLHQDHGLIRNRSESCSMMTTVESLVRITYHKFSAAKHLKNQVIDVINSCRSTWLSQLSARTYRIHTAMYRLYIIIYYMSI